MGRIGAADRGNQYDAGSGAPLDSGRDVDAERIDHILYGVWTDQAFWYGNLHAAAGLIQH